MGFIFKPIRWALGQIIIFVDWATRPKQVERTTDAQKEVDVQTEKMALYQFQQCPFCVKTRRQIRRLALNIETRDAQHNPEHREELLQGGGQIKVPCLKIVDENGNDSWMYESNEILEYLQDRFAA